MIPQLVLASFLGNVFSQQTQGGDHFQRPCLRSSGREPLGPAVLVGPGGARDGPWASCARSIELFFGCVKKKKKIPGLGPQR